ncbi:amidohydrolase family protein [Synergistaceae bacterium OttesenSCG-928-D05]|nr:amidohydrolase family protein [Synergistaceae bacterium OttesenSCG-928-D05]
MITLFKNATLLDCTGADPVASSWVAVEDKTIREIGQGQAPSFSGAEVVDCKGNTLMPGLIDAHIHLHLFDNDLGELHRRDYPAMHFVKCLAVLKDTQQQGFTTVRDAGGADAGFRVAVERGMVPGPKISVCGTSVTMTGGHADMRLSTEIAPPAYSPVPTGVVADGVVEVQKAVREQLRRGVDHIKVMAGGGCGSPADEPDTTQYTLEEIQAAVKEAKAVHKEVLAHTYSNASMRLCADAGVYSMEHGNYLDKPTAQYLKEKNCWLVPTMTTYFFMSEHGEELGIPAYFLRKMKLVREYAMEAVANAMEAGVKIGSGSDVVGSGQFHKATEIALKAEVMGSMKAILSATLENAKLLKQEKKIGTVEPGKAADLLLVQGDPLKDPALFQNRDNLLVIMQDGAFAKKML